MSNGDTGSRAPKRKLSDDEKLEAFMRSFHAMCQKSYWPQLRVLGRIDLIGTTEMKVDLETGQVSMAESPLDPLAADLAGAYMRKLITGTDIVDFGELLNVVKRVIGRSPHLAEARHIWRQADDRKFKFLADGDQITTMKVDLPREWTNGRPRDEGERREVNLSIADFAKPYFYTGFLHDFDETKDTPARKLVRSIPPVIRDYMAHLAIAASIYISTILHHLISTRQPGLCPEGCQEVEIMARLAVSGTAVSNVASAEGGGESHE